VTVVVLLGAPGAGKGTQAALLRQRLNIPHVATGDLFRAAVSEGSPVGLEARRYMARGQLVPDAITIRMVLDRLSREDAAGGAILDGFPRNAAQAEALDEALRERGRWVDAALLIDVPSEELVQRLSGRWICRASGHVYHATENPPRSPGVCDLDGSELIQRADDQPATIRARLDGQLGALNEVVGHYRARGILATVDGLQPIADVAEALIAALEGERSTPRW
jgi:adenylate kinase